MSYGEPPRPLHKFTLQWDELMHYLYLPIRLPHTTGLHIPDRLQFLTNLIRAAFADAQTINPDVIDWHIYITARHGHATPDNPLNRPGWHCDGFGTEDLNYIWWDRWPTRFALQPFHNIHPGHSESMRQFDAQVDESNAVTYPDQTLLALNPYVVHATPIIPPPGGMRRFVKISFSPHRYNLRGNSHNYLLNYNWPMYDRNELRNDPAHAERDYMEEP